MMDPGLLESIRAAHSLPHLAPGERLTEFASLADLLDQRSLGSPDDECLVFYDEQGERRAWSYAGFTADVRRIAHWLGTQGVGRGDRIATVSHNHAETVLQYFAAWLIGAIVVPINVGEDDERIGYILADSEAKLAFVRAPYLERIIALQARSTEHLPALETLVVCGGTSAGRPDFAGILAAEEPAEDFDPLVDDEALIVYTSGTTGNPKGVVLSQYNLLVDAGNIVAWHGVGPGDRMMCVLPIHHVNGTIVTLVTPLLAGGTAVLNHRFHATEFFARLAAENIAVVSVVPTLLAFLLQAAEEGDIPTAQTGLEGLEGFRHIICGAGPLTVELAQRFENTFGLRIVHGYGLSETTCYSCFLPVDLDGGEHRAWIGDHGFPSIGCAIPANEMDIFGPDNEPVPEGDRGEIVIRGHNVMVGYYRNDEANRQAFAGGWFHSGDEGFWRADARGRRYFFITGRLKELIIRGGVNVSPLEIDEVLMNLPGVKAGVSVGFANDVYGEEIGAYVVMDEGGVEDGDAILAACRKVLPHHKCPKVVVFGTEVPVTSTGKYRRGEVKPLFSHWQGVQFRKPAE